MPAYTSNVPGHFVVIAHWIGPEGRYWVRREAPLAYLAGTIKNGLEFLPADSFTDSFPAFLLGARAIAPTENT